MNRERGQLFGPESTNPRLRRAFAHAKLSELRRGTATLEETVYAIRAAISTKKGENSHFEDALAKSVPPQQRRIAALGVTGQIQIRRTEVPREDVTSVRQRDRLTPPEAHTLKGHKNQGAGGRTHGALTTSMSGRRKS